MHERYFFINLLEALVEPVVGLAALRAVGHVRDRSSGETRRSFAESAIRSRIPELRYGAIHVLADLGDSRAITELKQAASREPIAGIRGDIERLISALEQKG